MSRLQFQAFALTLALIISLVVNRRLGLTPQRFAQSAAQTSDAVSVAAPQLGNEAAQGTPPATQLATAAFTATEQEHLQTPRPPAISVAAAVVQEIGNPYPLYSYEPIRRWPLASLTKLMTALVASERMPHDQEVTIGETDVATEGNSGKFSPGERFTVSDIISAMLAASSNDGAEAIARTYGRSEFLEAMNDMAATIGLSKTSFSDPTGLSVLSQSTALDITRLVDHIARTHPELLAISRRSTVTITDLHSGHTRSLATTNEFAGDPTFVGGKTGYTEEAEGNLVSVFRVGGKDMIIVVLGTTDRFEQTRHLLSWVRSISK